MPKEMDTAFYDRIHAYIPGWEFQKTSDAAYTSYFGLVTDYLAEVFRDLRKRSYGDHAERLSDSAATWEAATRRPCAITTSVSHDLKGYDFNIQAINLNQAKEGSETAVAFVSLVSSILGKSVQDQTVVLGEMSIQGMLRPAGRG